MYNAGASWTGLTGSASSPGNFREALVSAVIASVCGPGEAGPMYSDWRYRCKLPVHDRCENRRCTVAMKASISSRT